MINKVKKTDGFGVPSDEDGINVHCFKVLLPLEKNGIVKIEEFFGYERAQGENPNLEKIDRIIFSKNLWDKISKTLKENFTPRLKEKGMGTSRWFTGENKVDRILGKEMCVLAWAIEKANSELEIEKIKEKWIKLTPEERWWLFRMTSITSGTEEDKIKEKGWRHAIYIALSE
jgi:hypothetical protein